MVDTVSSLLSGLSIEVRRDIVRALDRLGKAQFSSLLAEVRRRHSDLSASNLSYHLSKLDGLVQKVEGGSYELTPRGKRVNMLLFELNEVMSASEKAEEKVESLDGMTGEIYDLFHKFLLDQSDPTRALRAVERIGREMGERIASVAEFESLEELERYYQRGGALDMERSLRKVGDLYVLASCPFSQLHARFLMNYGKLPEAFSGIKAEAEERGYEGITCAFCVVHTQIRQAMLRKVKGREFALYQLGCKSLSGERAIARRDIDFAGTTEERVSQLMDEYVCVYAVRPKEPRKAAGRR